MSRPRIPSPIRRADAVPLTAPKQLDLFPVKPVVEHLDPRQIVGARTAVENLVRVRLRPDDAPHLIYHDRHGWYCETHGPHCEAVRLAREQEPTQQRSLL